MGSINDGSIFSWFSPLNPFILLWSTVGSEHVLGMHDDCGDMLASVVTVVALGGFVVSSVMEKHLTHVVQLMEGDWLVENVPHDEVVVGFSFEELTDVVGHVIGRSCVLACVLLHRSVEDIVCCDVKILSIGTNVNIMGLPPDE